MPHGDKPMVEAVDENSGWIELRAGGTLLALEAAPGERPHIIYAGPDIEGARAQDLARRATKQHAPGTPMQHQRGSLANEVGVLRSELIESGTML